MNKRLAILTIILVLAAAFAGGAYFYRQNESRLVSAVSQENAVKIAANAQDNPLVRPHSPVMGREDAPVTIVEFFDPSCESCRAAFPFVHAILEEYPDDVRLVFRYAAFHKGSDVAVGILEAARRQDLFVEVLAALLYRQPEWAKHPEPDLEKAWGFARDVGLDITRAREDAAHPAVALLLQQDAADIETNHVRGTPTFFVGGKMVEANDPRALRRLVEAEVEKAKAARAANPAAGN